LAQQRQADLENIGPSTTLASAKAQVPFRVLLPATPVANKDDLGEVHEAPGPGINMAFPRPDGSSPDLDPADIHVNEAPWTGGDPHTFNEQDIAADPDVGKSICQVGSLEALCQVPSSPSADGQSNGAFVRVIIGQTAVELAGGDSVERLQSIAKSLVDQAPSSDPIPTGSTHG
jgi:hypothetical protein